MPLEHGCVNGVRIRFINTIPEVWSIILPGTKNFKKNLFITFLGGHNLDDMPKTLKNK